MGYHTRIIFGKEQVKKYRNNEAFTDCEKSVNFKVFVFDTKEERSAFYKGVVESVGRLEFEVINEFEDKINDEKKEVNKFDYWAFIEKYYPKYYSCDSVLLSDILARKLNGKEICEEDKEYIEGWDFRKELFELDKDLLCVAFENYFNSIYPEEIH